MTQNMEVDYGSISRKQSTFTEKQTTSPDWTVVYTPNEGCRVTVDVQRSIKHTDGVSCVRLNTETTVVASACSSGIYVSNLETGKQIRSGNEMVARRCLLLVCAPLQVF